MYAVGADHDLGANRFAGLEMQFYVASRLRQPNAFLVEMNGAGLSLDQRLRNHAMQIAAMNRDVGKTVAFDRLQAEVEQLPALPGIPQPDRLARRQHLYLFQRVLEPERVENARAVGADLHAGAKLAQFRRLFVDIDVDAATGQSECGRQPANPAADNCDIVHAHSPLLTRLSTLPSP